jgi:hypothetical protein
MIRACKCLTVPRCPQAQRSLFSHTEEDRPPIAKENIRLAPTNEQEHRDCFRQIAKLVTDVNVCCRLLYFAHSSASSLGMDCLLVPGERP